MVRNGSDGAGALDPEVVPLARRRQFSTREMLAVDQ